MSVDPADRRSARGTLAHAGVTDCARARALRGRAPSYSALVSRRGIVLWGVLAAVVACGVVGAVGLSGGSQDSSRARAVTRASSAPKTDDTSPLGDAHVVDRVIILDDRRLAVGGGCPKLPPQVDVGETSSAVRLRVRYTDTPFACLKFTTVTLGAPLGQRQIVDMTTGRAIPVEDQRPGLQPNPSTG